MLEVFVVLSIGLSWIVLIPLVFFLFLETVRLESSCDLHHNHAETFSAYFFLRQLLALHAWGLNCSLLTGEEATPNRKLLATLRYRIFVLIEVDKSNVDIFEASVSKLSLRATAFGAEFP